MNRLSIIIALIGVLVACQTPKLVVTSYEVMPITTDLKDSINSNGVFYALPRQSVEIDILIRKQEFIKGPYAEFAERLLGVKNVIKENHNIYSIEDVSISQKSEIDPNNIYFVKFNDSELALEYDNSLIIRSVNTSRNEFTEQSKKDAQKQVIPTTRTANRPVIPTFNLFERTDTVFLSAADTQLVQRYEIRTVKAEKSPLQKAEEIVANIAKIREDRNRLLTGFQEVNYEAAAIKYMNEEFNRMEDDYIRLFTGTMKTSYETARFDFLPENRDSLTVELTGFSTSLGLLDPSVTEWASDGKKITLTITLNDDIFTDIQAFSENIKRSKKGFYYSIPSQALVKILLDNQVIFSTQMPFSQFGYTQSLAPNLLQIDFLPKTGEIRSIRAIGE